MYMLVKNVVNGGNKETSSNIKTFEGTSWENCQNVNSACDCWLLHTVNELSLNLHAWYQVTVFIQWLVMKYLQNVGIVQKYMSETSNRADWFPVDKFAI